MYKDLSNHDIAMDIYQKIMHAKTVRLKDGRIFNDTSNDHININEIVEYLFMHKMNDKTEILNVEAMLHAEEMLINRKND
jgi:hypothetical protein